MTDANSDAVRDHDCILVAEDDAEIRELVVAQLRSRHYRVIATGSVAEVRTVIENTAPDLLLLDLNLPDGDGVELFRELRAEGHDWPVIMVTARTATIDRIRGLDLGADDYLCKPFEPRELHARIRNLLRRTRGAGSPRTRTARLARFGTWKLELQQRCLVASDGGLVILSAAEFRLLCRFLEAPDRILSREDLVPERAALFHDRSIDLRICRLRHKLAIEPGGDGAIATVRSEGYVMHGPVVFE